MLSKMAREYLEREVAEARSEAEWHRGRAEGLECKARILARAIADEDMQLQRLEDDGGGVSYLRYA
jgi:hypothetical protein